MSFLGLMTKGFDIVYVMVYLTLFLLFVKLKTCERFASIMSLFKRKHFDKYER